MRCFSSRHPSTRVSEADRFIALSLRRDTPTAPRTGAAWPRAPSKVFGVSAQPFAQGHGGGGGRRSQPRPGLRPEDIPATPVSLRRIGALFRPYRARLGGLLALIFLSAGLGVISPFLLREVLDKAIPDHNTDAADACSSAG